MRVLADEQFNELTEHIKQLEAENQYLKKLLDDAGISYDKTEDDEMRIISKSVARNLVEEKTIDISN